MELSIGGLATDVLGLGPGRRTVLWVRGCSRNCPGCIAPEFQTPGPMTSLEEAHELVASMMGTPAQLTISGGEPFEQADALCGLLDQLRSSCDAEVLVYTGYRIEEVASDATKAPLLALIDLLIDGEYRRELEDTRIWRGSDNQRIHLVSERARRAYGSLDEVVWSGPRPIGVSAIDSGTCWIVGIPKRRPDAD